MPKVKPPTKSTTNQSTKPTAKSNNKPPTELGTEPAGGVVHDIPPDLRDALKANNEILAKWNDLTPLARNEWICWTISVKKPATRQNHIKRICEELLEGHRRPCCWAGCFHR